MSGYSEGAWKHPRSGRNQKRENMKQRLRMKSVTVVAVIAFAAVVAAALAGASASHAARPHAASPKSHPIHVSPNVSGPQRAPKPGDLFSCESRPLNGSQGPTCYTPQQIQQAYGYSGLLASGVDGAGKTIVIIDAYDNPYLQSDLNIQDGVFGLPSVTLHKVQMPGVPTFNATDGNQVGWGEEETLDVLWAHAMAPAANITLVEAASNQDADILAATQYAVDNNLGDVISQSFGEAETCVDPSILAQEHVVFQQAVSKGMTLFASSGDSGASQFNCDGTAAILAASSPASDPLVTGVGGTTLSATDPAGMYSVETAWTEPLFGCNPPAVAAADINCSGGGFSTLYERPSFQQSQVKGSSGRGVPDVAYNAGVNGGVLTHCGVCNLTIGADPSAPYFFLFGGTSAGSPQWAALTADAAQMAGHDLGNINSQLYSIAAGPGPKALHDVIQGNNDVAEIGGGYNAGQGWDPVTGLGTPNAAYLLPALAK
jgi:subtilase family serine protease